MLFRSVIITSIAAILGCLLAYPGNSQTEPLKAIEKQFSAFQENNYQEKLFAHLDRSFYLTGENIWFKFYSVDAILHRSSELSRVAYVEVIDQTSKTVLEAKISLDNGKGSGFFYIPNTLNSGKYKFRAYTSWMKNAGERAYFEKEVSIVNTTRKLGVKAIETQASIDIQFFPEGGNLVEGVESKIGFKAVDKDSKGVDFRGFILNERNDTLVRFSPLKFGLGSFFFKPVSGEAYRSLIISGKNKITKDLPKIYPSGYVLSLREEGDALNFVVESKNANSKLVYLIGQSRQTIKVAEFAVVNNEKAAFVIDRKRLGEGVNQFTLFDESRQPLCERLFFNPPTSKLNLDLKTDKNVFASREKVSLEIGGTNNTADLSMSVFLLDSLENNAQDDINAYLWLTSELAGKIESPSYYLNSVDENVKQATDNLMLTHGWRRYNWETILKNKIPAFKYVPESKNLIVSALVRNKTTGKPANKVMTYLSSPGKMTLCYTAETDSGGIARFPVSQFYGARELVVQTNNEKDSVYKLEIINPFAEPSATGVSNFKLSESLQNDLQNRSINSQVEASYLKDKKLKYSIPAVDSLPFFGKPDKTYLLDAYTRFPTIEEVMREYVPEVTVRKRRGEFHFHVLDQPRNIYFENDPLILLDGVPIFNTHKFMDFDPLKIKKLEVVSHLYFYGQKMSQGIVSYHTYNGDLAEYELDPRAIVIEYDGLQLQKEFYSPSYDSDDLRTSRIPDLRNTLYWAPSLSLDSAGKAKVTFFTSDAIGKYAVFVQGISKDGKAGSAVTSIEVKKPL